MTSSVIPGLFHIFFILYKDRTKPTAICPKDIAANTTDESGRTANISYLVSCLHDFDENITPVCNATQEITQFPLGETVVECSCEDKLQNTDQCYFKVTVTG